MMLPHNFEGKQGVLGRCANGERHIMFLSSNCLLFRKSGLFSLKKILRLHDYNFMLRF